jgi:hypothetical protein
VRETRKGGRGPGAPFVFNVKWIWTEKCHVQFLKMRSKGQESEFLVHLFASTRQCYRQPQLSVLFKFHDVIVIAPQFLRTLSLWTFHNACIMSHSSGIIPFLRTHVIDRDSILAPNKSPFGQTPFFMVYDHRLFYLPVCRASTRHIKGVLRAYLLEALNIKKRD